MDRRASEILTAGLLALVVGAAPLPAAASAGDAGDAGAPAGDDTDDGEAAKASRTPPPPPKSKKAKTKRKSWRERKAEEAAAQAAFEAALVDGERALARRKSAQARADAQIGAGKPLEAARDLGVLADIDGDPALMVAAAEAALAGVDVGAQRAGEVARGHAVSAEARIAELQRSDDENALVSLGLDADGLRELSARAAAVKRQSEDAAKSAKALRNGKGELITGAVLAGLGVSGFGVMGGGLYLKRAADQELASGGINSLDELDPELRPPFEDQYGRASTMTAVGAVVGAAGLAFGGTLLAVGIRDLKRAGWRSGGKRAALRAAPTAHRGGVGLVLGGRF
ncbi:MAG: hypothetical protein KC486_35100 [Myxococcales bacterium]|nr:hypothetical protein [Myxococcales bacterium]